MRCPPKVDRLLGGIFLASPSNTPASAHYADAGVLGGYDWYSNPPCKQGGSKVCLLALGVGPLDLLNGEIGVLGDFRVRFLALQHGKNHALCLFLLAALFPFGASGLD